MNFTMASILFLVYLFSILYLGRTHGCVEKADIIFLIDASGSVGKANFEKMLNFTSSMVSKFHIGPNHVQIAVITFDSKTYPRLNLSQYYDITSIQTEIHKIPYTGQLTDTGAALKFVLDHGFDPASGDRLNAKDVLVVMTDGVSDNAINTVKQAYTLKERHIKVISIGIGNSVNKQELIDIASFESNMFMVTDFTKLSGIEDKIHELTCNNDVITTPALQWFIG